jgi:D-alanyl-D-alanine carboxypeptidase
MRPRRLLSGIIVLALVTGIAVRARAGATANRADRALDRALEKLVAMRGSPPGVIVLVQRRNELKLHTVGVADRATNEPMRPTDHMRIASISKAFSGAAALALVSQGVLRLADTVGKWLPDLPTAWHAVTLRQTLNHTSGLPDFSASKAFRQAVAANLTRPVAPRQLLDFVKDDRLEFKPGSKYRYSNSDNVVAALMVQAATGKTYDQALQEQVFGPLGLSATSLPVGTELASPFIHGYDNDPGARPPEDLSEILAAGWAWASGGIVSTAAELNRFIRGYVSGELFSADLRAEQRHVVAGGASEPPGPGTNAAGLALFRYRTRCGTVWGHTGNTFGYTQFAAASPDGSRSVTVSVNIQLSGKDPGQLRKVFAALRRVERLAVCAALSD